MNEKPKAKGKFLRFLEEKGFYIILFLCAVAIGIAGYVLFEVPDEETSGLEEADAGDMSAILDNDEVDQIILPGVDADADLAGDGDEQESGGVIELMPDSGAAIPVDSDNSETVPESSDAAVEPDTAGEAAETASDAVTDVLADAAETAETVAAAAATVINEAAEAVKNSSKESHEPEFFVKPVSGEVLKAFCITELVYDRTMGDWRTHNGVDIAATNGQLICAIADGTVTGVYSDEYYGSCIKVEHGGGLVSIYYGLAENPTVATGDTVKAGDTLGALSTAILFESLDPVHLHLEVTRNGEYIDPISLFTTN